MHLISQVTIFMNKPLILRGSESYSEFAMLVELVSLLIDVNTDITNVSFLFCFK